MILDRDIIDNPSNEATVIVRISDNISLYQIPNDSLHPKKILARVPALAKGEYTLKIITRFSTNAVLLNEARVIEYDKKLIVP